MQRKMTYIQLTLAAVFWGMSFNAGNFAVQVIPPLTVTAWRFVIATVIMVVLLFIKEPSTRALIKANWLIYLIMGVVGVFLTNSLQFTALKLTSPLHPALIMATNPIVTVVLSFFFMRERIRLSQMIGMLLSVIGVVCVITNGAFLQVFRTGNTGDLFAVGADVTWALYAVLGRKYLRNSSPISTTTFTMLIATLCLLPFATWHHKVVSHHTLVIAWLCIIFMASFGAVLTFMWWNRAIVKLGASKTSVFFNLVPVVTLLTSALMGQSVGIAQIVGTLLVLLGVVGASLQQITPFRLRENVDTPREST